MIKVPATQEGLPAIHDLIAGGINVNITLLFAQAVYEQVVEAYVSGLEALATNFRLAQAIGADGCAHCAIDDDNALAEQFLQRMLG